MNPNIAKSFQEKRDAEEKMLAKDYVGARDKLLRAQRLFPAMDDINSMLAVCNILSAANIEFPGCGIDYYWIFQLTPACTLDTITSRYQKVTTLLQPIKNKFPCVKLALKLLKDAFSLLSCNEKRSQYDKERSASRKHYESLSIPALSSQNLSSKETITGLTIAPSQPRGSKNSSSLISGGSHEKSKLLLEDSRPFMSKSHEFREFDKHKNFTSQETGQMPSDWNGAGKIGCVDLSTGAISSQTTSKPAESRGNIMSLQVMEEKRPSHDFYDFEKDRKLEYLEAGQIWAVNYKSNFDHNSRYAQIEFNSKETVFLTWLKPMPVTACERRWCDAGLPVACGSFELSSEMSESDVDDWLMVLSHQCSWVRGVTEEKFEIYPKTGEIWALFKDWNLEECSYNLESAKECRLELVEITSDFCKYLGGSGACLVKVDGFRSIFQRQKIGGNPVTFHITPDNLYVFSHKVPAYRFEGGEMDYVVDEMVELDQSALPDYMFVDIARQKESHGSVTAVSSCSYTLTTQLSSLTPLPDDDQVLNPRWCSADFVPNQVWALYCGKDSLPQKYSRIDNVVSGGKVCVTILEPLPILDNEIDWQKKILPPVCGIFIVSGTKQNIEMSQFSHLVRCQPNTNKAFYKIYPLKGEIWAMYKNWNSKWKQTHIGSHEWQIVQIMSDLSDGDEIKVARLREVKGYLTFFQRQEIDGFCLTHAIPRPQMLSFSHQIPAFRVPGIGKYGIPESSWHLEPNALPPKC